MGWGLVANIKGPPGDATAVAGAVEVWSGVDPPAPRADYLIWIDTDAPDAAPVIGDLNFVYTQVAPSASWSVTHNLGKFPAVQVVDSGQSLIIPDVHFIDVNHVTLLFASATSGKAYFN